MGKKDELTFWDRVAPTYDESVLRNPPPMMHEYELWEDQQLDSIMSSALEKRTIFLELGSGTGRYLLRYGKLIQEDSYFNDNLLAIVGLDFSEEMIKVAIRNLKAAHLEKLIGKRIFLIRADATNPPISFMNVSLHNFQKVVAIMFGTIGNIRKGREKLLQYLCSDLLNINGIGVISFFNKDALTTKGGGLEEYSLIPEIVGSTLHLDPKRGIVRSEKKFFTEWFQYEKFAQQIESSNLEIQDKLEGPGPKVPTVSRVPLRRKVPRGYIVVVAAKCPSLEKNAQKMLGNVKESISQEKIFQKMLVCPECRTDSISVKSTEILCRKCEARFPIKNINGVGVPDFLSKRK